MQSITKINLRLLRDFLRLPQTVTITGVRSDPASACCCILELEGSGLPDSGEVTAEYSFINATIPAFERWSAVEKEKT